MPRVLEARLPRKFRVDLGPGPVISWTSALVNIVRRPSWSAGMSLAAWGPGGLRGPLVHLRIAAIVQYRPTPEPKQQRVSESGVVVVDVGMTNLAWIRIRCSIGKQELLDRDHL